MAQILVAEPIETWRIELEPADIPNLYTLEHPLDWHAQAMVADPSPDGEHVRHLVSMGKIDGPMLATAREGEPDAFFIDGLHRMWAWAELARIGCANTIHVSLVITAHRTWWAEQRARSQG